MIGPTPHDHHSTLASRVTAPASPTLGSGTPAGRARSGAAQDEVRRHNLSLALSIVHAAGAITRSELTERTGLSRSTIKALVAELVALGAIQESGSAGARPGAGRPSLVVSPRPTSAHVLAADVGVDRVVVGAYSLGGGFTVRREVALTGPNPSVEDVVAVIRRLADDVRADPALADPPRSARVLGLSVAIPAIVGAQDGVVRFAPNLDWVDEPFGERLRHAFAGMRVLVGNDSDLGAVGEHLRGAAQGVDDLVYVHGDVGIGAGFVLGGRSVLGATGYAGEVGHVVTVPGGALCRCGVRGCWETEVGAPAVAAAIGRTGATVGELRRIVRAAGPGERAALEPVGVALGRGVGLLVNLLNPSSVVLGGLLRDVHLVAPDAVAVGLRSVALRACAERVRLVPAGCGDDAVLIGAAEILWQALLADPAATLGAAS